MPATEYTQVEPRGFGRQPFGDPSDRDKETRTKGFGDPKTKYTGIQTNPTTYTEGEECQYLKDFVDPVASWAMNDNKDNATVLDLTAAYNGVATADTFNLHVSGRGGGALDMQGKYYVEVPHSDDFTFVVSEVDIPFSISAWIDFKSLGTEYYIAAKTGADLSWLFYINSSGYLVFQLYGKTGEGTRAIVSTSPLGTGVYHVVGTWDGSGNFSGLSLYCNGSKIAGSDIGTYTYTHMRVTSDPVNLGAIILDGFSPIYCQSYLDSIKIFRHELSAAQIAWLAAGYAIPGDDQ